MEKFGVFVRSVGERTQELCVETVQREVDLGEVHVIRDLRPAWKAYDRMFELAETHGYTWYLGLDADVILLPGWRERAWQKMQVYDRDKILGIGFPVQDYFFGKVDKGTHFYSGRHTKESRRVLREHTRFLPKPESSIRKFLTGVTGVYEADDEIIGYHGYEQYYKDIYYRFYLQRIRRPRLGREFPWLRKRSLCPNQEYVVAHLGWQRGRYEAWRQRLRGRLFAQGRVVSDIRQRDVLAEELVRHGVIEKQPYERARDLAAH